MWDERKNPDWAPKIFKTQRIQTQKINTNLEISSTNAENQTQEHKKIKPRTHEHKPKWGFKVGTKSGFLWPNLRRPPSPFPQIQSLPLMSNDEWNNPQERSTSSNGFAEETRRPGVGESEWGLRDDEIGDWI